jgi:hypothetical protein
MEPRAQQAVANSTFFNTLLRPRCAMRCAMVYVDRHGLFPTGRPSMEKSHEKMNCRILGCPINPRGNCWGGWRDSSPRPLEPQAEQDYIQCDSMRIKSRSAEIRFSTT